MAKRERIELITGKTDDVMIEMVTGIWNTGAGDALLDSLQNVHGELSEREKRIVFTAWTFGVVDAVSRQAFIGRDPDKPPQKGDSPSCET